MKILRTMWRLGMAASVITFAAHAQGVLTITPGRIAGTTAGTGIPGYTGDNAAAVLATLASPSAMIYDASGNLYLPTRTTTSYVSSSKARAYSSR